MENNNIKQGLTYGIVGGLIFLVLLFGLWAVGSVENFVAVTGVTTFIPYLFSQPLRLARPPVLEPFSQPDRWGSRAGGATTPPPVPGAWVPRVRASWAGPAELEGDGDIGIGDGGLWCDSDEGGGWTLYIRVDSRIRWW